MRRILPFFLVLSIACACTMKEDTDDQVNTGLKEISMAATISDDCTPGVTKSSLGTGGKVQWTAGDAISLLNISGTPDNSELTLTSGVGTSTATFTGEAVKSDEGYYGVYPYNAGHELNSDGTLHLEWYGNNQLAVADGADLSLAMMTGKSEDGTSISFKNLFALVKFTVEFECNAVKLKGNDDETLACATLTTGFDTDGNPVVSNTSLASSGDVTANLLPASGSTIQPGTYYLAVLPQTLSNGFTIEFEDVEGVKCRRSTSKEVTFKRSGILDLGEIDYDSLVTTGMFRGSGTSSDPYLVTSKEQLDLLAQLVRDGEDKCLYAMAYYAQTSKIDCGGSTLSPIGSDTKPFYGSYDGRGNGITNFVPGFRVATGGVFGYLCDASVKNLTLTPKSFTKEFPYEEVYSESIYFGVLAAHAKSTEGSFVNISNCHVTGTAAISLITRDNGYANAASILAQSHGEVMISGCTNSVSISVSTCDSSHATQETVVGGIVGEADANASSDIDFSIDRCRNTGKMYANGSNQVFAGGIIGRVHENASSENIILKLTNCVNGGDVTAYTLDATDDAAAGGIVGSNRSDGKGDNYPRVCNCLNTGSVTCMGDDGYCGGIMGFVFSLETKFYGCVNTGKVSSEISGVSTSGYDTYFGAIAGDSTDLYNPGDYYWCYWTNSSSMPIVSDGASYTHVYGGCSYKSSVSCDDMNAHLSSIPAAPTGGYESWTGSTATGDLDIDF